MTVVFCTNSVPALHRKVWAWCRRCWTVEAWPA